MSHFIVFKRLSILAKLGMVGLVRAGHSIEIWMMLETRYGEPFHRKSPNLYVCCWVYVSRGRACLISAFFSELCASCLWSVESPRRGPRLGSMPCCRPQLYKSRQMLESKLGGFQEPLRPTA